ncbi:hypothetical protein FRB97_005209 [Tulasnella sp. 331]|nr:hypothetical protein FRB97_005209 [Tulasnella sp. 331]
MIESPREALDLSNEALSSQLHAVYPLIDTALIAALLSESDGNRKPDVIEGLLETFEMLTLQAKSDYAALQFATDEEAPSPLLSDDISTAHDETETTDASWRSSASGASSESPLTFLMTAFPDHPPASLQAAFVTEQEKHAGAENEVDMEAIVQHILSQQFIDELEERGLDEVEAIQAEKSRHRDWSTIASKKKGKKEMKKERDKGAIGTRTGLGNAQQRQQCQVPTQIDTSRAGPSTAHPDPWTHLSSLASRLSELLPPLPASHFLSLFHDPTNSSPVQALRQELERLQSQSTTTDDIAACSLLLKDILYDESGFLDADAEMCIRAVGGDVDTALELVWLLQDLDNMGPAVSHSPVVSTTTHVVSPTSPTPNRGAYSALINAPPTASLSPCRPPSEHNAWTKVAARPRPKKVIEMDPLGEFIPAYKNMPAGWRAKSGRASGEPELDEQVSESQCRYWSEYYRMRRDESLRDASRYWKKNWAGAKGGDVALVYAEDSREHERRSKLWAMKAARMMVDNRQKSNITRNTVDLHGLTVNEAVTLSQEAVNKWWNSSRSDGPPPQPLTLITGRGNHSKGKVGVIGPAVQNALEGEGWRTSKRPGAIAVTGWKHGNKT